MFSNERVVAYDKMSEVLYIVDEVVLTYSHTNIFSETKMKTNARSFLVCGSNTVTVLAMRSLYSIAAV